MSMTRHEHHEPVADAVPAGAAGPAGAEGIESVALVSLGCPKNLVDSEKMLGILAEAGLVLTDEAGADAIVINTCGFLEASKEESLAEINAALERKRAGQVKRVVVAGCLVQRQRARILDWCPGVDALIGVFDRDQIAAAVRGPAESAEGGEARGQRSDVAVELPVYSSIAASAATALRARGEDAATQRGYYESDAARLRLTPRHYAYLRISEGCNQHCSFCTIPSIRGKMRSKPVESIVTEARELIADGAAELNLIGQDTTSYGQDIGDERGLPGLLETLAGEARNAAGAGNVWLRLMYAYPSCFGDDAIEAIARLPEVVKYIDMPLQHINDRLLDAMRRRTSRRLIETLLHKLRDRIPGIAIRTTFITGYPGETEAEHEELVAFIRDFGFDAMGAFIYSPEPGTPAGTLHAREGMAIPAEVAERRYAELMRAQQEVVFARHEAMAREGRQVEVLIDSADGEAEFDQSQEAPPTGDGGTGALLPEGPLYAHTGRSYQQAPSIDGTMLVLADRPLSPGERISCRIIDADGYDLICRPVTENESGRVSLPVVGGMQ